MSTNFIVLVALCAFLCSVYCVTLYFSIKKQIEHFGRNRYLEMTYYLLTFVISCKH